MKTIIFLLIFINSFFCVGQKTEKHYSYCQFNGRKCNCEIEYVLKDSIYLIFIKNKFYKNKYGHLYDKTEATKDGLNYKTYFNGCIPQEIDPITFVELEGSFAKDKNYVYYVRPTSGGMQMIKIEKADPKTFKIFKGVYKLGVDENYFFDETDIVEGINVKKIKFHINETERTVKIISGKIKKKISY